MIDGHHEMVMLDVGSVAPLAPAAYNLIAAT